MSVNFKNTEAICLILVTRDGEEHHIDLGNYFMRGDERVLITTEELAAKYGHLVDVPIYTRKNNDN